MTRRVFLIVLDSVGIGDAPDAAAYGDEGANTLGHISERLGSSFQLPTLRRLGLANIAPLPFMAPVDVPRAAYGRMVEASAGKDTTTGHWELAGLILDRPFPLFPEGFPPEVLAPIEAEAGVSFMGNVSASGTEIIARLGAEHLATGRPIVYTSGDSVFQVAAHVDRVPLEELYRICRIARRHLQGPQGVGRVIARPFTGRPGDFRRLSAQRKDFSLPPPESTLLDAVSSAGLAVTGVGKIADIFAGRGVTASHPTGSNAEGMACLDELVREAGPGLVFANLVDFDSAFGHRRDPEGYGRALVAFDRWLAGWLDLLAADDLLLITADHGNDPTWRGTDHTRETVPLLIYRRGRPGRRLGVLPSYRWVAGTVAASLGVAGNESWPVLPQIAVGEHPTTR